MPKDDQEGARILVVDDEPNITDLIATALRFQGFEVKTAGSGKDAIASTESFRPHLILLDVMLPDFDGFEVQRRLATDRVKTPVIFLTARDETESKVRGLTMGADDYVTKPFSLEELIARVRTVLRRAGGVPGAGESTVRFADLELDEDSHEVRRANTLIDLTPTEFTLLRYLLINAKRVMSKAQILDHVWQYDFGGDANVVETYISYLRKKIDGFDPPLIQTIRGVGYCLRLPRD